MTPALLLRNLTQRFGTHTAVDSLDLEVMPGSCSRSSEPTERAKHHPAHGGRVAQTDRGGR
jgi:hypothetical protein